MYNRKEELFMAIVKCLPYPDQISNLDFSTEKDAICFTWRKTNKFRVALSGDVEEVGEGVLIGSDISIMFRQLIKRQYVKDTLSLNKYRHEAARAAAENNKKNATT